MFDGFSIKWDTFVRTLITKGGYKQVLDGLENTIKVAVVGLIIGILIGLIIAIINVMPSYKVLPYALQRRCDVFLALYPKPAQDAGLGKKAACILFRILFLYYFFYVLIWFLQRFTSMLKGFCSLYVALFRGTPVMVQLLLGYFVLFPSIGFNVDAVQSSMIIFGFNSGAYVSEMMRGGINSVDPGQMEAARAVGFSYSASMLKIVVPQAVKNILPTLGNEFIALIKETSIIGYAGALDLVFAFKNLGSSNYEFTVPYIVLSFIYIILVVIITIALKIMERWLAKSDRRH